MPTFLSQFSVNRLLSDEELYRLTKRGELRSFDLLYARYERGLFRFIYGYLKNRQESEEIFHEAFLSVLDSSEVAFTTGSFQGWVYRIARNLCLNRLRSKKRSDAALCEVELPIVEDDSETLLIQKISDLEVQTAMDQLPRELSEVLRLRLSGLQYQEISQILEIPLGTVKSRFHTIVKTLRESIPSEAR
jgi:RNA polymerase sigma factor (sigma-70 family)